MIDEIERRRLEGRVELLEGAPARYAALTALLTHAWFDALGDFEFAEFAAFDGKVREALVRVATHPALEGLRAPVEQARQQVLEALERLHTEGRAFAAPDWAAQLDQMTQLARARVHRRDRGALAGSNPAPERPSVFARLGQLVSRKKIPEYGWRLYEDALELRKGNGPPSAVPLEGLQIAQVFTDGLTVITPGPTAAFLSHAPAHLGVLIEFARSGLYFSRDLDQVPYPVFDGANTRAGRSGAMMFTYRGAVFVPYDVSTEVFAALLGRRAPFEVSVHSLFAGLGLCSSAEVAERMAAVPKETRAWYHPLADLIRLTNDLNFEGRGNHGAKDYVLAYPGGAITLSLNQPEYERLRGCI